VPDGELALRGDPRNIPEGHFVAAFYGVGPRYRRHECTRRD
jgi:hypothetical protein